jgi:hypothetical protein
MRTDLAAKWSVLEIEIGNGREMGLGVQMHLVQGRAFKGGELRVGVEAFVCRFQSVAAAVVASCEEAVAGSRCNGVMLFDERGMELLPGWRIGGYVAWCMAAVLSVSEVKRDGVVGWVDSIMG